MPSNIIALPTPTTFELVPLAITAAVPKNRSSQNTTVASKHNQAASMPTATMASLIRHRNSLLLPLLAYARHIPTTSAFVSIPSVNPRPVIPYGYFQRTSSSSSSAGNNDESSKPHIENVLFVECGFGNDSHGQSSTKAAVRACRNAIEFNSIPSINRLVPGGYDALKLDVILAVPPKYQENLDLDVVSTVFPYGDCNFTIQDGGMIAPSGIAIERLGDINEDMVVVCCSVTVGY